MNLVSRLEDLADRIETQGIPAVSAPAFAAALRSDAREVAALQDQWQHERDRLNQELAELRQERDRYYSALVAVSSRVDDINHLKRWLPATSHNSIPLNDLGALGDLLVEVANAALKPVVSEDENPVLNHPRQATYQAEVKRYAHSNWLAVYRGYSYEDAHRALKGKKRSYHSLQIIDTTTRTVHYRMEEN